MLEQLKYKNHINEVFEFGKDGIFVDTNDLHDYEWNVVTKGSRIASLGYAVGTKTLPVTIICETEDQGIAARNRLHEVVEKDVLAMQHGQIIIGDYYFKCFVTKSQKSNYLITKRHLKLTLTLTTDFPYWVKETKFTFRKTPEESTNGGLDYTFDFPFDYCINTGSGGLDNGGFVGTNFRMIIYGPASNPAVYIADHLYHVRCGDIGENEYLTIDSINKTITLTDAYGNVANVFNMRNRDSYIFEKIQPGNNVVTWDGDYGFDLILLEERSEPKWT